MFNNFELSLPLKKKQIKDAIKTLLRSPKRPLFSINK